MSKTIIEDEIMKFINMFSTILEAEFPNQNL